ncbi:hypothetical protein ACA910_015153 [Epithemia clementina (nom. ined.)]
MAKRSYQLIAILLPSLLAGYSEAWVPVYQIPFSRLHTTTARIRGNHHDDATAAAAGVGLHATVSGRNRSGRPPSRVSDPDGPTPEMDQDDVEEVDPETIEGLREMMSKDELPRPIPHQPWRLGSTAGCEAPIDIEWRQAAERVIETSVKLVGGKVLDVTWYLTQVIVTLDENITIAQRDLFKSSGPVIEVEEPQDPQYFDPNDPEPEEILDPDEVMYQRQSAEEMEEDKERKANRWAAKDEDDPIDEPHNPDEEAEPKVPLYMNDVTRQDVTYQAFEDELEKYDDAPKPFDSASILIDTAALSTIAGAILEGLEEVEDQLNILSRHELVLTSPGAPDVLETQKQFNAFRGANVIVETQDPWESNRTLKGQLVDRNSMDVIINQKGRMVTIPHCFVKCVRIPRKVKSSTSKVEADEDEDDDEDDDDYDDDDDDALTDELVAYEEERANGSPMP